MHKIVFLLKTYEPDFLYVKRLITTYNEYNKDMIPLYIVLPGNTIRKFELFIANEMSKQIVILEEERICDYLINKDINGISCGYVNQEIIKLSFWENNFCENYLCLDSEAIFIRDFFINDFMHDKSTPYTVLIEDNDLKVDPQYYNIFWKNRERALRKIQESLDINEKRILTCHGFQIFSCTVLNDFKKRYMNPKKIDYKDLIAIAPYEFSWYNFWLQKEQTIPIYICEPLFKTFHMSHQHLILWIQGITLNDLSRGYIGIVINSNFSKGKIIEWEDTKEYCYDLSLHQCKKIVYFIFKCLNVKIMKMLRRKIGLLK